MIETDKELKQIYDRYLKICWKHGEKPDFSLNDLKRLRDKKKKKESKKHGKD